MQRLGVDGLKIAFSMVSDSGKGADKKIQNPPTVNRIVTFGDETRTSTYGILVKMEKAGLVARNKHETTIFNVTQTDWELTPLGLEWFFFSKEEYEDYRAACLAKQKAYNKLSARLTEWGKSLKEKEQEVKREGHSTAKNPAAPE